MEQALGIIAGLIIGLLLIAIFTVIFRAIWNLVMPDVFGVKRLSFLQALGILILSSILFGGHRVIHVSTPPAEMMTGAPQPATERGDEGRT